MKRLYPKDYVTDVFEINFQQLYKRGYRGIMFDIDNTLSAFDQEHPSDEIIVLFKELKEIGFRTALVSNNNRQRVTRYNEKLKVPAYPRANKPLTMNLKRAIKAMGINKKQAVFVGDQLFTDVWAGNCLGVWTVLVKPIQQKEQVITRIKRGVESFVIRKYLKAKKKH